MNTVQYVTEYEYATFALLSVLLGLYSTRKKLNTATNNLFLVLMIYTMISTFLHIITTKTLPNAGNYPLWFNYLVNIAYLLAYDLISVVYLVYVAALTKHNRITKADRIYAVAILLTDIILLLSTPFNKWVIYFDENMTYRHGPLFFLLPGLSLSIIFYSIIMFVKYRKDMKPTQSSTIIFFASFTIIATIIQLMRPQQIIGNFAIALTQTVMFISLENPADYVDRTTDCPNREAFAITVQNDIEQKTKFSVIAFHSEGLGYISELAGIAESSRACTAIARDIKTGLKTSELYYLGDWTFAILLKGKKRMSTENAVKAVNAYFDAPLTINGAETTITPLICSLEYPGFTETAADVIDAAEYTLRSMKKQGESYSPASPEALDIKKREMRVLALIKQFMINNRFEVYYQPIYDVKSKSFISAEALIRMRDEELGFISPDEFIPLAESNGLIVQIGELVFRSVCDFLKNGRALSLGIKYIEVNLSTLQCVQEKLAPQFLAIMEEYGIEPEMINFEITETAGLANFELLRKNMDTLIASGSSFSMDDYGTGFSTANYLITLPADIVKIDKSIIWPAMKDSNAFIILKHTVEMLRALDKEIVAEGAETDEMVRVLSEIGCDFLQGYYYSKPVPADEFIAFLEKHQSAAVTAEK